MDAEHGAAQLVAGLVAAPAGVLLELVGANEQVFEQDDLEDLQLFAVLDPERDVGVERERPRAQLVVDVEEAQRRVDDEATAPPG